jgi:hypothetical protein
MTLIGEVSPNRSSDRKLRVREYTFVTRLILFCHTNKSSKPPPTTRRFPRLCFTAG